MSSEEDFSFPTTTDSPPYFLDSPPLWRWQTTLNSPTENPKWKEAEDGVLRAFNLNSSQELHFKGNCNIKQGSCFSSNGDGDGVYEEEKMDMLWEDLNEEFSRKCERKVNNYDDISSPGRDVRVRCVKAIKLSRANGHMITGKKPNILVFIKVLKKFFVSHNNSPLYTKKHAH